jgi:hypothetical protein
VVGVGRGPLPQEISREADVLPAQRRTVLEQAIRNHLPGRAQMCYRVRHIGRVPIYDRGDDKVETRGAELLSFGAAVGDPPLLERADHLGENVALLALVQSSMAPLPKLWAFKPVEHEQRSFDPAEFLERKIELILPLIG